VILLRRVGLKTRRIKTGGTAGVGGKKEGEACLQSKKKIRGKKKLVAFNFRKSKREESDCRPQRVRRDGE